jgi:hypothetical protein
MAQTFLRVEWGWGMAINACIIINLHGALDSVRHSPNASQCIEDMMYDINIGTQTG